MGYIDGFQIPLKAGRALPALLTDKFGVPWVVNVAAPKP
jgi:hypothetical protein